MVSRSLRGRVSFGTQRYLIQNPLLSTGSVFAFWGLSAMSDRRQERKGGTEAAERRADERRRLCWAHSTHCLSLTFRARCCGCRPGWWPWRRRCTWYRSADRAQCSGSAWCWVRSSSYQPSYTDLQRKADMVQFFGASMGNVDIILGALNHK